MKRPILHQQIVLAAAAVALILAPDAAAAPQNGIVRTHDPVIIKGSDIPNFLGVQVAQVFVYAYSAGRWTQLPAQVDEIDVSGRYVASEDGVLDGNDEVVFMARDLGDPSGGAVPVSGNGTAVTSWYELTVSDPTHPGDIGWAYVVRSASIVPDVTMDYVSFNESNHRIIGGNYALGFASPRVWLDYLTLGGSSTDILDRLPKYRFCLGILCFNENLSPNTPDGLIKDGRVRIIMREGRVLAYGWMAISLIPLTISPNLAPDWMRFSTDFNASATGAIFYSDAVPGGVSIDGSPDAVPASPFSSWSQVSHGTGTMIVVLDPTEMGGTVTNYYVDDLQNDNQDSGDKRHYGDAGVHVAEPNLSFTLRTTLYFLDGTQPKVGEAYAGYSVQPLEIGVQWQSLTMPERLYLPIVVS